MVGKYVSPSETKKCELAAKNAITLEALSCPKCAAPISIRAMGLTQSLTCSACDSLLDLKLQSTTEKTSLVQVIQGKNIQKYTPAIPLGSRFKFHGTIWEVIGFMVRGTEISDQRGHSWREYLLFNPYKGYRWLVEDEGHWNYYVPLHDIPHYDKIRSALLKIDAYDYSGNPYKFHSEQDVYVQYVKGEFYWRVRYGDKSSIAEFVYKTTLLSRENTDDYFYKTNFISQKEKSREIHNQETNWSFGEYLFDSQIKEAFQGSETSKSNYLPLSPRYGIAINQPLATATYEKSIYAASIALLVFFLIFESMIAIAFPEKTIYQSGALIASTTNESSVNSKEFISDTFEVTSTFGGLGFVLSAPDLNNDWLAMDVELVNEESGDTLSFDTGVEYYSGYDSDGSWSEGSRINRTYIPSVPKGKYKLITTIYKEKPSAEPNSAYYAHKDRLSSCSIKLIQNYKDLGISFLIMLFLIFIYPGLLLAYKLGFRLQKDADNEQEEDHNDDDNDSWWN